MFCAKDEYTKRRNMKKHKPILLTFSILFALYFGGCNQEANSKSPLLNEESQLQESSNEPLETGGTTEDILLWELPIEILESEENELNTWEPYYEDNEGGITYFEHYGYWRRSLGLYSFAVSGDELLFVDDSASRRVAIYRKGEAPYFLPIPESHVCDAMRYDEKGDTLYLLLVDNTAVEPGILTYCKFSLKENKGLEILGETPYDVATTLAEGGEIFYSPRIYDYGYFQDIVEEEFQQKAENIGKRGGKINLISQYEDISLFSYFVRDMDKMYLLLWQQGGIAGYAEAIDSSSQRWGTIGNGYLYEQDGEIAVAYMVITDDNKLQIRQAKLFSQM